MHSLLQGGQGVCLPDSVQRGCDSGNHRVAAYAGNLRPPDPVFIDKIPTGVLFHRFRVYAGRGSSLAERHAMETIETERRRHAFGHCLVNGSSFLRDDI